MHMKQFALIGPTASGKTALAVMLAKKLDAVILSLDSLSLYKEIDIASAKPTMEERGGILHFGIDILPPDAPFDVTTYIALYQEALSSAKRAGKALIIVGGTGFYLKMLLEGISDLPAISPQSRIKTKQALKNLTDSHAMLAALDSEYMRKIKQTDRYRIEKVLDIYFKTGLTPSAYFTQHPPQPIIQETLPIYQITVERALLRERIDIRTQYMIKTGLIDEVCMLEHCYGRTPNSMKAIGIKETLAFLDGTYSKAVLGEQISTHTAQLAKRQNTFNNSQFDVTFSGSAEEIYKQIC